MLLRRALLSAHSQTFRDYLQGVVCDGGNVDFAHQTIGAESIDHSKILLIDNAASRGMEAASNIAIWACGYVRLRFITTLILGSQHSCRQP